MTFRTLFLSSAIVLSASIAGATELVVPKFSGDPRGACRSEVLELVGSEHRVQEEGPFTVGKLPRDKGIEAVQRWLGTRAQEAPSVRVAIVGTILGSKLRLGVYSLPDAELIGLKTLSTRQGKCRFGRRRYKLVSAWLADTIAFGAGGPAAETMSSSPEQTATATQALKLHDESAAPPVSASKTSSAATAGSSQTVTTSVPAEAEPDVDQTRLEVSAGVGIRTRSWSYPEGTALAGYEVDGMPVLEAQVLVYPFRWLDYAMLKDVALRAIYRHAVGVDSESADGRTVFDTTFSQVELGAFYLFSLERWVQGVGLGPEVAYRHTRFVFDPSGDIQIPVPSVSYDEVSLGGRLTFAVRDNMRVALGGAYLLVFGTGADLALGARYGEAEASGYRAGIVLEMDVLESLRLDVYGQIENFSVDLQTDAEESGSASAQDRMTGAGIRAVYRY